MDPFTITQVRRHFLKKIIWVDNSSQSFQTKRWTFTVSCLLQITNCQTSYLIFSRGIEAPTTQVCINNSTIAAHSANLILKCCKQRYVAPRKAGKIALPGFLGCSFHRSQLIFGQPRSAHQTVSNNKLPNTPRAVARRLPNIDIQVKKLTSVPRKEF